MTGEKRVVLPLHEWKQLGPRARREVARLARQGRRHPNARVASVARAWASETLRQPQPQPQSLVEKVSFVLTNAPLGGSMLGDARLARRILAAEEHQQ
jgi:hypothetical protein